MRVGDGSADNHLVVPNGGVLAFRGPHGRRTFLAGAFGLLMAPMVRAAEDHRAVSLDEAAIVARGRAALRKRTVYKIDTVPPSGAQWPAGHTADCSGFVAWCYGLPRYPRKLRGAQLFTTSFYEDAVRPSKNLFVKRTEVPTVGGIVVYPYFRYEPGGKRHPGHIAIISVVRSPTDYDIIDCSETSYLRDGDAIAEQAENVRRKFSGHAERLATALRRYPTLATGDARMPVFAMPINLDPQT